MPADPEFCSNGWVGFRRGQSLMSLQKTAKVSWMAIFVSALAFLAACNGTSSSSSGSNAMVSVSLSDPATCGAPNGPFSHIYVTVDDVQINQSSTASDNDPGWVD